MSGVNSQARSFYGRSAAEPLADTSGTLGFRGTPVENHCYRRLWWAILRNGPITAIIRLVKLALLECFRGYIKRVMREILVRLFIWPFCEYIF